MKTFEKKTSEVLMCIKDEFQDVMDIETNFCDECMSLILRKFILMLGAKNQIHKRHIVPIFYY
jgi:hypothetical protein